MKDATLVFESVTISLNNLANSVVAVTPTEVTYLEQWGWTCPAITKHELAKYILSPIELIAKIDKKEVSESDHALLSAVSSRAVYIQNNSVPQLPSSNAFHVYHAITSLIELIQKTLSQYAVAETDWSKIEHDELVPAVQKRRLKNMEKNLDQLSIGSEDLAQKIAEISTAHVVALKLPETLASLTDAQDDYKAATVVLEENGKKSVEASKNITLALAVIEKAKDEAQRLVGLTEQAKAAAVTQGLGAAFEAKAKSLQTYTIVMTIILLVILALGFWASKGRISQVQALMLQPNVTIDMLWINVTLTLASLGAPIWAAWFFTKQIGQRFRLAEDYSFKASFAKAYEGYLTEAKRHGDPEMEKRLFSLALDRLSEIPLRLIEKATPGTPLQDLAGPFLNRRTEKSDGED
jgi:hypothetical protein